MKTQEILAHRKQINKKVINRKCPLGNPGTKFMKQSFKFCYFKYVQRIKTLSKELK